MELGNKRQSEEGGDWREENATQIQERGAQNNEDEQKRQRTHLAQQNRKWKRATI